MSHVLVLGGYGGFGGRVSRQLAQAGHRVCVVGRDKNRAEAFCESHPLLRAVQADRAAISALLARYQPDIVVDASGPFQSMDYRIPAACIEARVHYLDLADASTFVNGIAALDAAAFAAGVVVCSGASSVPALSGAVVRLLTRDLTRVSAIDIAISASNRASAGPAVAASILDQVGQRMQLWRGRRWKTAYGWQNLKKLRFDVKGQRPILGRWVGLVDVPDIALLPIRVPGHPAVSFRAGTELSFQNIGVWLASWTVRWGLVSSLKPMARWVRPLQKWTENFGSDRSAMVVEVVGVMGNRRLARRWTLIASSGDGPEIPALSIAPLIERIMDGREVPGARDAGGSLDLTDYQRAFDTLDIAHEIVVGEIDEPLYARVAGESFNELPTAVREMHAVLRDGGATGSVDVVGAGNPLAALIARVIGFPGTGSYPLHVSFAENGGNETWTRDFGDRCFSSQLSQDGSRLVERFGPLRFAFKLSCDKDGLAMVMVGWSIGSLALPLVLAPRSRAREWEEDAKFHFDVAIALPFLGPLVRYRGWLAQTSVAIPHATQKQMQMNTMTTEAKTIM